MGWQNKNAEPINELSIGDTLAINHTLEALTLSCPSIGFACARSLSEGLMHNETLKRLSFFYCCALGDDGYYSLVEALTHHPALSHLFFEYCHVGDKGIGALSQLFKSSLARVIH